MSDKELARALLNLGSSELSPVDAHKQTQAILARDRRRVKILAVVTVILWIGSAGVLYWFIFSWTGLYAEFEQAGGLEGDPLVAKMFEFLLYLASAIEGLIFALLCTLLLIFFSRRATLRQINANLVEISQQIKELGSK